MKKRIGTHNGTFHCDEVLACSMLHHTKEFKGAEIIRSRDPAVLNPLDCLVDVGSVYDPAKHRYDHHQAEFYHTLDEHNTIKLSSAGLIYKHFGREVITNILGTDQDTTELIYKCVYKNFIEAIDAIDNGISVTDQPPRYRITTDLSSRVGMLNPSWNDPSPDLDGQFYKAMEVVGSEFVSKVNYYGKTWLPAREIVEVAVKGRYQTSETGEIFLLDQFCPWQSHLHDIEEELNIKGQLKYVLFADQGGQWRIQCIPKSPSSFENIAPLPVPWRGKRDEELSSITGIDGCVFVHSNGFIGGNKTKEGIFKMAHLALKMQ